MTMERCTLTFLGTGTCQLIPDRIASSILIESDDFSLLFDIGYSVSHRLAELGKSRNAIATIYLSHFHPDHCIDLVPFLHEATWTRQTPRTEALTIIGPPGTTALLENLRALFSDGSLINGQFPFHIQELPGGSFTLSTCKFTMVDLPPAGNHGLLFTAGNQTIGISGDGGEPESLEAFCRSCDCAIIDIGHLDYEALIGLLSRAQTPEVIGTHVYQEYDVELLQSDLKAAGYTGKFSIASDRMIREFST